jgi:ribonuclease III
MKRSNKRRAAPRDPPASAGPCPLPTEPPSPASGGGGPLGGPAGGDGPAAPPGIDVGECQRRIDYVFRDPALLVAAFTHASGAQHRLASNERLEFLGDAILGFVVCETLYHLFPDSLEGDLTRIKSVVVSRETCGRISERLQLIDFLIVGKGLSLNRPVPESVLSDLFESLVAAIYIDGGLEPVRSLVSRMLEPEIVKVASGEQGLNHKSLLQQLAQRDYGVTPTYEVVEEAGPDHSKSFHVVAQIGPRRYAPAWGRNKKEAEQRAACNALAELRTAAGVPRDGVAPAARGRRG